MLATLAKAAWAGSPGLLPLIFLAIWPSIWPQPADIEADKKLAANNAPTWAKVLFLLSNIPYLGLTLWLAAQPPMYAHPWLPAPVQAVCRLSAMYATVGGLVATSSLLMHGAQLQMMDGCCACIGSARRSASGKPCRPYSDDDHPLHRRSWQVVWKKFDFACVLSTVVVPGFCMGSAIPIGCLLPCSPLFFIGQRYKDRGEVMGYIFWHSAWHIATAFAAAFAIRTKMNMES